MSKQDGLFFNELIMNSESQANFSPLQISMSLACSLSLRQQLDPAIEFTEQVLRSANRLTLIIVLEGNLMQVLEEETWKESSSDYLAFTEGKVFLIYSRISEVLSALSSGFVVVLVTDHPI